MRIQLSLSRREDGAVAVLVAIFAVVLLVVAAFTTDFGMAYAQRRALSTGADSAALAIIHAEYASQLATPTRDCDTAVNNDAAQAKQIALTEIRANAPFKATIADSDVSADLSCNSTKTVLQVNVVVNRAMTPILGQMAGASTMNLTGQAVAAMGILSTVDGLTPLAICVNQYKALATPIPPALVPEVQYVPTDKVWKTGTACNPGDTTGGTGNWGWLDLGASKPGSIGASVLSARILAHNGTIALAGSPATATVYGDTGEIASVQPDMQTLLWTQANPRLIYLPVYDSVTGKGSNSTFNITGFVTAQLCAFGKTDNHNPLLTSTAVPVAGCAIPEVGFSMGNNDMQLKYVDWTPTGDWGACTLGTTATCGTNPELLKTRLVQ